MKDSSLHSRILTMMNIQINASKAICLAHGGMKVQVLFFYDKDDSPLKGQSDLDTSEFLSSEAFQLDAQCVMFNLQSEDDSIEIDDYCRSKISYEKNLKAIGLIELIFFKEEVKHINQDISTDKDSKKALYAALYFPGRNVDQRVDFYTEHGELPVSVEELEENPFTPRYNWRFFSQPWNSKYVPTIPLFNDFFKPLEQLEF